MNTTEQLTHIRSKCVEAVPSILDLKFGCEIKNLSNQTWTILLAEEDGSIVCWHKKWQGFETPFFTHKKTITEIIGRPIQLSDILLAINNTGPVLYGITSGGVFAKIGVTGTSKYNMYLEESYWNNLDDNLDHQSPECIQFLYELLYV